jgi:hypothetical protein
MDRRISNMIKQHGSVGESFISHFYKIWGMLTECFVDVQKSSNEREGKASRRNKNYVSYHSYFFIPKWMFLLIPAGLKESTENYPKTRSFLLSVDYRNKNSPGVPLQ